MFALVFLILAYESGFVAGQSIERSEQPSPAPSSRCRHLSSSCASCSNSHSSLPVTPVRVPTLSKHSAMEATTRLTAADVLDNSAPVGDARARDSLTNLLCSPISFKRCAQSPTEATLPCSPCFVDSLHTKHADVHVPVHVTSHADNGETLLQLPQRTSISVSAVVERPTVATVERTSSALTTAAACNTHIDVISARSNELATDSQQIRYIDDDSDGNGSEDDAASSRVCIWPSSAAEVQPLADTIASSARVLSLTTSQHSLRSAVQSKHIALLCCGLKHSPRSKSCRRPLAPATSPDDCVVASNSRRSSADSASRIVGSNKRPKPIKSASLPSSPIKHNSKDAKVKDKNLKQINKLLRRNLLRSTAADSSDDESVPTAAHYTNLETFQKARFNRKVCANDILLFVCISLPYLSKLQ